MTESLNTYHVLLLYPEHFANHYGETYCDRIEAENEDQAVCIAKHECLENIKVGVDPDPGFDVDGLVCLLVVKGGEVV